MAAANNIFHDELLKEEIFLESVKWLLSRSITIKPNSISEFDTMPNIKLLWHCNYSNDLWTPIVWLRSFSNHDSTFNGRSQTNSQHIESSSNPLYLLRSTTFEYLNKSMELMWQKHNSLHICSSTDWKLHFRVIKDTSRPTF